MEAGDLTTTAKKHRAQLYYAILHYTTQYIVKGPPEERDEQGEREPGRPDRN